MSSSGGVVWLKDGSLKDPFRNDWKRRIRRRPKTDQKIEQMFSIGREKETTAPLFIPPTPNAELLKLIIKAVMESGKGMDWKFKIMEQSERPSLSFFLKSVPILSGCPKGDDCIVCDGKATKSTPRALFIWPNVRAVAPLTLTRTT